MTDRNQPLMNDESKQAYIAETAPVYQGNPYEQNPNPQNNYNQYPQGQPPNYQQGPPPGYNPNMPPPPPQNYVLPVQIQNHPQIVVIREQLNVPCQMCGSIESFARRSPGCATFSWCVCLFCFTGIFCFWIPFVIDRCYDVEIVCPRCLFVKAIIEANCV